MHANVGNPALKYKTADVEALAVKVETKLKQRFGEGILSLSIDYDYPVFVVKKELVRDIVTFLYNDSELEFRFLTTLAGLHYPDNKGAELGVMYQLHNLPNNWRIRIKTFFAADDANVPSITTVFRTANWMERQEFDFFGINFEGHPNMKRILNMDEMTYHPMLKQYPLEDAHREDKDNSFFGR